MPDRGDLATRADVEVLVRDFYREVAADDLLGPVFRTAGVDWAEHVPKLIDFWCTQLFDEPGYTGHPLRAHEPVHRDTPFRPEHYERWLELFGDTVDDHFAGPGAELAKHRATKLAGALRRLLDSGNEFVALRR